MNQASFQKLSAAQPETCKALLSSLINFPYPPIYCIASNVLNITQFSQTYFPLNISNTYFPLKLALRSKELLCFETLKSILL